MSLSLRRRLALELARARWKGETARHQLRQLFWECTLRCNVACLHCGSDCRKETSVPDMPVADFLRVIDEIADAYPRHPFVIITGGEPLVRRDIEAVGIELYRRRFPWGIVTNGMLLDKKRLDTLRAAGIHSITVSLDGFAPEHNWLRGNPRCFDNAIRAIDALAQVPDVLWDVVTCVNSRNVESLPRFKEMLVAHGVKRWRLFTIFPMGRAASNTDLQLDTPQFQFLLDFIRKTREEGIIHASYCCEGFLGDNEGECRDTFYHCNAGVSTASIRVNGDISGCLSVRGKYDQGNIFRDKFTDVWDNRFDKFRNLQWKRTGICTDCKVWRYCEGNGMHLRQSDGTLIGCNYHKHLK